MPFLTVIPCIRTPYGVDAFDYLLEDGSDVQIGDVIPVPFRHRTVAALVARISNQSAFSKKIISLHAPTPLIRFPPLMVDLVQAAAQHSFSSQASILHAWLRTIPQRAKPFSSFIVASASQNPNLEHIFTASRFDALSNIFKQAKGRTLILTPWQTRADKISRIFDCPVLHAGMSQGAAWKAWTTFLANSQGALVTTRLGAWLSLFTDTLLVDEPENDDYKQDELTPRLDARWVIEMAKYIRPPQHTTYISTTPQLALLPTISAQHIPTITPELTYEPKQAGSSSGIANLSGSSVQAIRDALDEQKSVIILHPISGERSRIACRDCGWVALCPWCTFPLSREKTGGQCHRCKRSSAIPSICKNCEGADLNRSRTGRDRLKADINDAFPNANIQVVDLPDWHRLSIPKHSLIILTDLALVGGVSEDIRRKERLALAWRRIAATAQTSEGHLIVQGGESLLSEARQWLTSEGLQHLWKTEWQERQTFHYSPAQSRIKIILSGTVETYRDSPLHKSLSNLEGWRIEGPFPVLFRSSTRVPRCIFHALPPSDITESKIRTALEPFAKTAIIDLDPIAFFS